MKTAAEILSEIRETLATPERWGSTYMAKNASGLEVEVTAPDACSFCLIGAAGKALSEPGVSMSNEECHRAVRSHDAARLLASVINGRREYAIAEVAQSIWKFNDRLRGYRVTPPSGTRHAELLSVIDEAYQHAVAAGI